MPKCFVEKDGDFVVWLWLAGDDEEIEGRFLNWYSNKPILYLPWPPNRPYKGGTNHNYLQAYIVAAINETTTLIRNADVRDEEASRVDGGVPVCTVPSKVLKLRLRGLCKDLSYNREYFYTINELGQQVYQGRTTSSIMYENTTKMWQMSDIKDNSSLITSSSSSDSLLLGLHQVSFLLAKEDNCYQDKTIQPIKLTSCKEGYFTCYDGVCIDMDKRCDQTAHCEDGSDEKNCNLVLMEENYNKNIAPFNVDQVTEKIEAVQINISTEVIDILNINEVEQTFKIKFRLVLSWFDFRLVFHNLKGSRIANSPSIQEVEKLWIPNIVFDNTENNDVITIDPFAKVTISKEGVFVSADETVVDEVNVFKGSENQISFDKIYTKTLKCIYQLQLYPFDTQECSVNLEVGKYERSIMMILPQAIEMKSETLLSQYFITGWKLVFRNSGKSIY